MDVVDGNSALVLGVLEFFRSQNKRSIVQKSIISSSLELTRVPTRRCLITLDILDLLANRRRDPEMMGKGSDNEVAVAVVAVVVEFAYEIRDLNRGCDFMRNASGK